MSQEQRREGFNTLGPKEIRLVEILPGRFDNPLIAIIRVVDFQNEPQYEALSYVWNPTDGTVENGTEHNLTFSIESTSNITAHMRIGANLDAAMRHLRYENTSRTMWIDAVSIHQEDTREKNHQVGFMGTIFSSAERVIIWLGPARKDSDFVMETISTGDLEKHDVSRFIGSLEDIIERDWFTRIWVAQELALARLDPLVYCGLRRINWLAFTFTVQLTQPQELDEWVDGFKLPQPLYLASLIDKDRTRNIGFLKAIRVHWLAQIRQYSRERSLAHILLSTIFLRSTDPRDRVFGLLGICRFHGTPISPDYTKTNEQVFAQATSVIITESFYPYMVFWNLRNTKPYKHFQTMPSWTSNTASFTGGNPTKGIHVYTSEDLRVTINMAHGIAPVASFSSDSMILYTAGHHLGNIARSGALDVANMSFTLKEVHRSFHQETDQDYTDRMLAALTHQFILSTSTTSDEVLSYLRLCLQDTTTAEDKFGHEFYSLRYTFFLTDTGMVGITTVTNVTSYRVAGLFGINIPFILDHLGGDEYRMVGVAYLPGHRLGHDFIENAEPGTDWKDFLQTGQLERFNIH